MLSCKAVFIASCLSALLLHGSDAMISRNLAVIPSVRPSRPQHTMMMDPTVVASSDGVGNVPRGGATLRLSSNRDKTLNILGIVAACVIVPSVAVPAVRIAATVVIATAVLNLVTGHGFVIIRR